MEQGMKKIIDLGKITDEDVQRFNVAAKKLSKATMLSASQAAAFIRNFAQAAGISENGEQCVTLDDVCEIVNLAHGNTDAILKVITSKTE